MQPELSPHAKGVIASVFAVILAGITAWQNIDSGHLRLVDVLPVAIAVVGAIQVHVVPNVPELPAAKAVIAGSSAVLAAVAAYVSGEPNGLTAGKILVVALGAFLTWYVPEQPAALVAPSAPDPTPPKHAAVVEPPTAPVTAVTVVPTPPGPPPAATVPSA